MRNIELSSLNLGDIVSRYHLKGIDVWKSYMEYPLHRLYADPVAYIYCERVTYPRKEGQEPDMNYLFHLVFETQKYELVAKGTDFLELRKKGDEWQEAFREKHFGKRDDFSKWNS